MTFIVITFFELLRLREAAESRVDLPRLLA